MSQLSTTLLNVLQEIICHNVKILCNKSNFGFILSCKVCFEELYVVVMDFEVLLGLGSHGNPQAQQRVSAMNGNCILL